MRIVWLADLHLSFCTKRQRDQFFAGIAADVVLISGDISIAAGLKQDLAVLPTNSYYVLGNHDYYGGSIRQTRQALLQDNRYLSQRGLVQLAPGLALLGHDGWYDMRNGDFLHSSVRMNDMHLIQELRVATIWDQRDVAQTLTAEATTYLARQLPAAMAQNRKVIFLTHVPPFAEAAYYLGQRSQDGLPFFSSKAIGDRLLWIATEHPKCQLLVLCGHTHDVASYKVANIDVRVAQAEYGKLKIAGEWDEDEGL